MVAFRTTGASMRLVKLANRFFTRAIVALAELSIWDRRWTVWCPSSQYRDSVSTWCKIAWERLPWEAARPKMHRLVTGGARVTGPARSSPPKNSHMRATYTASHDVGRSYNDRVQTRATLDLHLAFAAGLQHHRHWFWWERGTEVKFVQTGCTRTAGRIDFASPTLTS